MPSALIISRYFPPIGSAGASIRVTKFIKVALQKNWSIRVITQDPAKQVTSEKLLCGFLLDELPPDLPILRVPNPIFGKRLPQKLSGDSSLPWGAACVQAGMNLLKQYPVDWILANTPPFTNVAIGSILSKYYKIPLVVDFKDDWVGSSAYYKKHPIRRWVEAQIEKSVIHIAKTVFVVTRASYDAYTKRYKTKDKFQLFPNGLDLEEYRGLEGRPRKIESSIFTILTAATGYRSNYRDLTPLLKALGLFLRNNPAARNSIELIFLGDTPDSEYQDEINDLGLNNIILVTPAIGRQDLVEWLWKSDLFFLIQPRENFTAISGTLFEYWATGKAPVLLISEEGASSDFLKAHQLGDHYHFDDITGIAAYLEKTFSAWAVGTPVWIEDTGVVKYDRTAMTEKMIACLEETLADCRSTK